MANSEKMFIYRVLCVVAVRVLLLVGGEEGERHGPGLLPLLHRLRRRQPRHPSTLRLHIHVQVVADPFFLSFFFLFIAQLFLYSQLYSYIIIIFSYISRYILHIFVYNV